MMAVEETGARLVIDHMGVGDLHYPGGVDNPGFKAILAALERGNTWIKISGNFRIKTDASGQEFVVGDKTVIRDPDTGEVLDESVTEIARLRADTVKEKLSICSVVSGNAGGIHKGHAIQVR